jgi:hypothetical protein
MRLYLQLMYIGRMRYVKVSKFYLCGLRLLGAVTEGSPT